MPFTGVEGDSSGDDGIGLSDRFAKLGKISSNLFFGLFSVLGPSRKRVLSSPLSTSNRTVGVCVVSDGSG